MTAYEVVPRKGLGFSVQQVWIALAEHGPDDEGIPAEKIPYSNMFATLMVADPKRLPWLEERCKRMAYETGMRISIARFVRDGDAVAVFRGAGA